MNGRVMVQVWMDNKPVYFMTTLYRPVHETDTPQNQKFLKRKGRKFGKNGTDIPCSPRVLDHNNNMGGVDYFDQMMKYHKYGRKSKKWYMHVFYHLLELCIHKSFVLESYFVTFMNLTSKGKG